MSVSPEVDSDTDLNSDIEEHIWHILIVIIIANNNDKVLSIFYL